MLEPLPQVAVKQIIDPRARNALADCCERYKSRGVDGCAKTIRMPVRPSNRGRTVYVDTGERRLSWCPDRGVCRPPRRVSRTVV